MNAQIRSEGHRRSYMLGGDAKVTLVSLRTGARFTYRIRQKEADSKFVHLNKPPQTLYFVSVLTGPDNSSDFEFLGTVFDGRDYRHGNRSQISRDAPSARAFAWTWQNLGSPEVEVWHSGECSRCGRELTDPESIARGLGPKCAERAGAI